MHKLLLSIILSLFSITFTWGQTLSDNARVLLLTCTPGTEVWSKYGHTAIRILDPDHKIDMVCNYGVFNTMANDFYLKFVRGETYYQLGIDSYASFDKYYRRIGRTTYWQELNLSTSQKQKILDAILENYKPANRYYLYNFVFDNCATRPYYLLKHALGDSIHSDYSGYKGVTFREAISHYTGEGSWVDFGINLIFGSKADKAMSNEERLFLPEELMNYISAAYLSDGSPLVRQQAIASFSKAVVPWYKNCWLGIVVFGILMLILSIHDRNRGRLTWQIDITLCVIYILILLLVIFLTFFSCHPLVGFNWRLLIFPFIHICTRIVYKLR